MYTYIYIYIYIGLRDLLLDRHGWPRGEGPGEDREQAASESEWPGGADQGDPLRAAFPP